MSKERGYVIIGTISTGLAMEVLVVAMSEEEAKKNCGLQNPRITKIYENINLVGSWRF